MTIHRTIKIQCNCNHIFEFDLPQSITSWLYPDMIQKLVDGNYYKVNCPVCNIEIIVNGELMINSPKGIVLIKTGPQEYLLPVLQNLEIIDTNGIVYSSEILRKKLDYNMNHLEENPILKYQSEFDPMKHLADYEKEEKNRNKSVKKKKFWFFKK